MFSKSTTTTTTTRLISCLLALSLAIVASACDNGEHEAPTTQMGSVQMALTAVGSDGDTYRLRNAILHLDGPTSADVELDEAYGDSPLFEARVDAGEYKLSLADGWVLQRKTGDSFEIVAARLLTQIPIHFTVVGNATTSMALVFETVDGEIEFATGDLEVWLAVNHLDCEHGEYVTRSCGANLTGRQFNMCNAGWWQGWSECSARCDRGYCLFKDPATFTAATINKTVETVGFETYATGSPVPADIFAAIYGDVFSDQVNFMSVGASNQMFPWDSDNPFVGQKADAVVIYGGNDSGDATLRSSAGGHNFSGFDAIEAVFPVGAEVYSSSIAVDHNEAGFTISMHNADCEVVAQLPVSSDDGKNFIVLGDPTHRDITPSSSIIVTPSPTDATPHGTAHWAMTEFAYAY
jgi:hypothetical protein